MAFETYSNLAATTLTANYTAASGTLQVANTAGAFPTAGNFRVFISDPTSGAVHVILKVTAITDSTHFAVTAEGTDANANNGDNCTISLTAGGMDAIRGDLSQRGAWASRVTNKAGNLYLPSDAMVFGRDNASAFDNYGPIKALSDPNLLTFAQQDFGSCTSDTTHGGLSISNPTTESAFHTHALVTAVPGTPYHVEFGYYAQHQNQTNYMSGACFSDGTKYEILDPLFQGTIGSVIVFYLTNSTSFGNTPINSSFDDRFVDRLFNMHWVRLGDDGTNKTWDVSIDGINWVNVGSEARATNLTATKVGLYVDYGPSYVRLLHCKITA